MQNLPRQATYNMSLTSNKKSTYTDLESGETSHILVAKGWWFNPWWRHMSMRFNILVEKS